MCLAQGHNAVTPVRFEPAASRSQVKHSTTEPLRSLIYFLASFCSWAGWFESHFVGSPEDRFSRTVAHILVMSGETHYLRKVSYRDYPYSWKYSIPSGESSCMHYFNVLASLCSWTGWFESYLVDTPGPKVIKLFSCSTKLTKFQPLIKTKIPTNKEVPCYNSLRCCVYHANQC